MPNEGLSPEPPGVARSGRRIEDLTMDALREGRLDAEDIRISAATLLRQAELADREGYAPLAENLRRAAELVELEDDELLEIYEALRPGRSTRGELDSIAADLAARGAVRCAALVREAGEAYAARGIFDLADEQTG